MAWMSRGVCLLGLVLSSVASCSSDEHARASGVAGQTAGFAGKTNSGGAAHAGTSGSGGSAGARAGSAASAEGGAAGDASVDGGAAGMPSEAGAGGAVQEPVNCPARGVGEIGGPCQSDRDCDSAPGTPDGTCASPSLGYDGLPSEGYCIGGAFSTCPATCQAAGCAANDVCVNWAGCKACLPACCEGDTCGGKLVCASSLGDIKLGALVCVPGKLGAELHAPCGDLGDCGPGLTCVATQERPGGECTKGCTAGNDATCPAGGRCVSDPVFPRCAKACDDASDCRGAEGYACVDLGGAVGKVCQHALVGGACANDDECGGGAWHCQTGAGFSGGYCTLTGCEAAGSETGCPELSAVCFDPTVGSNYCVDRCSGVGTQSTCRVGYGCQDVDASVVTSGGCVPI
jgi:hypothetical protein